MSRHRPRALLVALSLFLTAAGTTTSATAGPDRTAGQVTPQAIDQTEPTVRRIAGSDRIRTSIEIARTVHDTANAAVLAPAADFPDALTAAPLARGLGGPLLLAPKDGLTPELLAELDRLQPREVIVLGGTSVLGEQVATDAATNGRTVRRLAGINRYATAAAVADTFDTPSAGVLIASGQTPWDALGAAPLAAHLGWPLLLSTRDDLTAPTRAALDRLAPTEVLIVGGRGVLTDLVEADVRDTLGDATPIRRLAGADRFATAIAVHNEALAQGMSDTHLWLASGTSFPDALAAGPAIAATGASLLLVDSGDLREPPAVPTHIAALRARTARAATALTLVGGTGAITADAEWQAPALPLGRHLPRGGMTLFPHWRMVAFYGNHSARAMGVLGEQSPDAAYDRLWRQAAPYEAEGTPVLPTFELIVSVATAGPADGDYSTTSSPEKIQPWLDAARRHGVYLLLDIQTGRTDFLTEAKKYEEFLIQPDVGLALDPEWRMDANEVPGESVGEVHADEVNEVVDYLAGLVREHHLPEKLLVVHQFQTRMIEQRHTIRTPAELAVLFHMDGHGNRRTKANTYRFISDHEPRFHDGYKLFYDEDTNMWDPAGLLANVRPLPDFISYQ